MTYIKFVTTEKLQDMQQAGFNINA